LLAIMAIMAILPAACEEFDPPSKLTGLRILAISAEPPEARPLEAVRLDALVWLPSGAEAPAEGSADGSVASFAWRACALGEEHGVPEGPGGGHGPKGDDKGPGEAAGGRAGFQDKPTEMLGGVPGARSPDSCFDLEDSVTPEELLAGLDGSSGAPDLSAVAIDLGSQTVAELTVPPPRPYPAAPSLCRGLSPEESQEQGGRETWISGVWLTISLRVRTAGETVLTNKRLVVRPAADGIPDARQGRPFRTPRLCEEAEAGRRLCARNENPAEPRLTTPDGEWSGEGPIRVQAGREVRLLPEEPEEDDLQAYVAMSQCVQQGSDPAADGGEYERREGRVYAWYSDGGNVLKETSRLDDEQAVRESGWRAPAQPGRAAGYDLIVVIRDARGGTSWSSHRIEVEP